MKAHGRTHLLPVSQILMLAGLAVAMTVSLVDPLHPEHIWLQHAPTVAVLVGLPLLLRRYPLSNSSMACITGFFLLHCLGAHYAYSFVPYDDWARALAGHGPGDVFDLSRNHYDRLVHLAFGALAIVPAREAAVRHLGLSPRLAACAGVAFVLAASLCYEVFEWLLAAMMSPDAADAYNGQQGDMFDAQKDMALAALGAATLSAVLAFVGKPHQPGERNA